MFLLAWLLASAGHVVALLAGTGRALLGGALLLVRILLARLLLLLSEALDGLLLLELSAGTSLGTGTELTLGFRAGGAI